MTRVILDCDLMKHRHSGLYYYCLNLGKAVHHIFESASSGEIRFYVPPTEANAFSLPGFEITERKWHSKWWSPFLWKCDVWHAPFQSGRLFPSPHQRIKILLTIHDLNVLHEDKPQKERLESLRRTQRLIDGSDAIVCISQHTKRDVLEHLDTKGKPVHVIYNGTHIIQNGAEILPRVHPRRPFVFTMGYVNRKKNFHTLLSLLKNPELELVIAGRLDEPDYVEALKAKAITMQVQDRVHVLGPVSEEDKAWYYKHCTAFVLPSLAEGFGAPVVEAMCFGKPVFLSSLTSLPEIGGDVAFYFRDFDPQHMHEVFEKGMQQYREEEIYAERLRARGQSFDWNTQAKEYIKVYNSLSQIP